MVFNECLLIQIAYACIEQRISRSLSVSAMHAVGLFRVHADAPARVAGIVMLSVQKYCLIIVRVNHDIQSTLASCETCWIIHGLDRRGGDLPNNFLLATPGRVMAFGHRPPTHLAMQLVNIDCLSSGAGLIRRMPICCTQTASPASCLDLPASILSSLKFLSLFFLHFLSFS